MKNIWSERVQRVTSFSRKDSGHERGKTLFFKRLCNDAGEIYSFAFINWHQLSACLPRLLINFLPLPLPLSLHSRKQGFERINIFTLCVCTTLACTKNKFREKIAVASCGKLWHCKRHKFCDYNDVGSEESAHLLSLSLLLSDSLTHSSPLWRCTF